MITELAIFGLVLVLGAYWFRYNCLSILKTKTSRDKARPIVEANELLLMQSSELLDGDITTADLEPLNQALLRDYEILTCLLRYTSPVPGTSYAFEERMLMADFRLMTFKYRTCRAFLPAQARRALEERTRILIHFANILCDRSSAFSRA